MRRHAADRALFVAGAVLVWAIASTSSIASAEGEDLGIGLRMEASCERVSGPGKVLCTVRERPVSGRLRWGDVIVVSAPSFAPPLRTRLAVGDATRSDPEGADFGLGLAATSEGRGTLRVRGRAVVCAAKQCRPVRAETTAEVVVGNP